MIIKVSTPWSHIDFNTRIPTNSENKYKFIFDESELEVDFWIIWGGIKGLKEKTVCPPENVIYLTDEVHEERFFNKYFLNQFAAIITCRTDLQHKRLLPTHELNTWMVDRSFDFLSSNQDIPKSKNISVVCSDQTWLPGHKLRYAFVNKLIGHFKDKLDVFGRGFNPIKDKYDALAPYRYSVAIENSAIPGYFTEKITDCFLTNTLPLYYGCTNIEQYFNKDAYLLIDPTNFNGAVKKIEKLLDEDSYMQQLPAIKAAKMAYLNEYHIFSQLQHLVEKHFNQNIKKKQVIVNAELTFERGYVIKTILKRVLHHLPISAKANFHLSFPQSDLRANNKQ